MRRILTLKEVISNLTNSYRFIDIRSIVGRQDFNYDWSCIFSKIRLTDDDSEKIKDIHLTRKQNLGIDDIEQSRFRFQAECRDIQGLNDIVDEILRGQVTICGVTSRLQSSANEGLEVQKYDYYGTPEERDGYHQWFIFLPNNGGRSTYKIATDLGITQEDIGLKLEFLNTWFDIPSTDWNGNTNNLALLMPIYIKRSEIFRSGKEKRLVKYFIHKELLNVCTARKITYDKATPHISKLDLHGLTKETPDSSRIVPIMLSIDNEQISKTDFEITHNSLGQLFTDRLGNAERTANENQEQFDETSLLDVIRNRENVRIERKSSFCFDTKTRARNNQLEKSISKAIQGFANSFNGGILLIGVDPDGKIIGLKNDYTLVQKHNSDGFELELRSSVEKYLRDKIVHELIVISFPSIEGEEICKIKISPSPKPIALYENGKQEFYVRVGNSTRPYAPVEFIEYAKRRFANFYSLN